MNHSKRLILLVLLVFSNLCLSIKVGQGLDDKQKSATQENELTADDGGAFDWFGSALSLSGNRIIVGAEGFDGFDGVNLIPDIGAAYVYKYDGLDWIQTFKLLVNDGGRFGHAVSLQDNRAAISAWNDSEHGQESGAVYIFEFDGIGWIESYKLTASDAGNRHEFGSAVSLDGDRLLIGASFNDANGEGAGAAYIFDFNGVNWVETQKLIVADNQAHDHYGHAVSLKGNRAVIGAPRNDITSGEVFTGKAYVFDFDGNNWVNTGQLSPLDNSEDGLFGTSIDFQNNMIVVGARNDDDNNTPYLSGSVYVFQHKGTNWQQTQELTAANGRFSDQFGISLKISNNRLLVGASLDDLDDFNFQEEKGAAYLFAYNGTQWVEKEKIIAANGEDGDYFGFAVDMQGQQVVIGDGQTLSTHGAGSAYVFNIDKIFKDSFE